LITSLAQLAPEVVDALMEMLMSRLHARTTATATVNDPATDAASDTSMTRRDSSWSNGSGDSGYYVPS
jgi:hypothetical protein